jgi:hypothetical protein
MNRSGTLLGWGGGIRLIALTFAMMVIVAFAIVLPAQVVLSKHLSPSPWPDEAFASRLALV